jgi:hypothetical protein
MSEIVAGYSHKEGRAMEIEAPPTYVLHLQGRE